MPTHTVTGSVKVQFTLAPGSTTYLARVKGKQIITLSHDQDQADATQSIPLFGSTALRPCMQAVCKSRPDLVQDPLKDHALAALDAEETYLSRNRKQEAITRGIVCSPVKSAGTDKIWEGKGMLSWILQTANSPQIEQDEDDLVGGQWDPVSRSLTVNVQLTERPAMSQISFFNSMRVQTSPSLTSPAVFGILSPSAGSTPSPLPSADISAFPGPANQATFQLNVIEPTPVRSGVLSNVGNGLHISSSSSPVNHGNVKAAPMLAEDPIDRQKITTLAQKLLAQLKSEDTPPQMRASIEETIQTLVVYLVGSGEAPEAILTEKPVEKAKLLAAAKTGKGHAKTKSILSTPHAGLCIDSLDAWLSSVPSDPPTAPSPPDAVAAEATLRVSKNKRKSETETPQSGPSQENPPVSTKLPKLKYDAVGCSNCGIHNTMTWRKSKKGKNNGSRICNACGVYYNRKGSHRPVTEEMRQAAQDHAANDGSLLRHLQGLVDEEPARKRPKKEIATAQSNSASPPRHAQSDLADSNVRRSPRRHSSSKPSPFVLSASPGSALDLIMSDGHLPEPAKSKRQKMKPRSLQSTFDSLQPSSASNLTSAFEFSNSLGPDLSSFPTSEPETDVKFRNPLDSSTNLLNGIFDAASWFGTEQSTHLAPGNLFSTFDPISDGFSDADMGGPLRIPPSSPPTRSPFAGLGAVLSDSGDSPDQTTDADTPAPNTMLDFGANGIEWSEEALAMLSNALLPGGPNFSSGDGQSQANALTSLLDQKTLQDVLASLATAGSPTPSNAEASLLDVRPVAEVNAGVANTIWQNEVMQFAALQHRPQL